MLNGLTNRTLKSALMAGAAVATIGSLAPAFAQDKDVEKVTVTGTRIPQKGLTSVSPVVTIDSKESLRQGTTSAEQLLNSMPQVLANQTPEQSNGASGTASIDLRGLGPQRTLVLINGRRMNPASVNSPYADLNNIPVALLERVEILSGGASAVYGADAVAGVVNFIMRKDFEGVLVTAQYGVSMHENDDTYLRGVVQGFNALNPTEFRNADKSVDDGRIISVAGIMGANTADGKGNVTLYGQYRHSQEIFQSQRDFSACALGSTGNPANPYTCNGSSTSALGRFQSIDDVVLGVGAPAGVYRSNLNGSFSPYIGAQHNFNFGPQNYLQRPNERYLLGATGHYDLADDLEVYTEISLADDRTVAQIASSGMFRFSAATPDSLYRINCDNPLLLSGVAPNRPFDILCNPAQTGLGPTDNATVDLGRRFVEAGGRRDDLRHTSYRGVLGFKGELDYDWEYDIYAQYGTTQLAETYFNDMSLTRINRALQVVNNGPDGILGNADDAPICKSVLDGTDPNCVPANVFTLGALTPAAVNYLSTPGFQRGRTEETVVSAALNGSSGMASPWAETEIALAVGGEYRLEELQHDVDLAFSSGDLAGQGGPTPSVGGHYDVWEAFGEIQIPLVEDAPWAKLLEINAGYRISDYDSVGITHTYKYGGSWAPTEDVRFRGTFQRAVRAPNLVELFTPQTRGLVGGNDPCASTTGGPAVYNAAQCANTGLNAAQYATLSAPGGLFQCPADQCGGLFGGNTSLKPEESDTISLGAVFTPTFFKGLSVAVDYFDIMVDQRIGTIPSGTIITECAENNNPFFCGLINRAPGLGVLFGSGNVDQRNINTGSLATTGIDVDASYRFDLADIWLGENGGMMLNFVGTHTDSYEIVPVPGGAPIECAGFYARECGLPTAEWRHKMRGTWTTPWDVELSLQWRYISSVDLLPPGDAVQGTISSYDYFDLALGWTFSDNIEMRAGVNNLTDNDPPIVHGGVDQFGGGPFNANTYPTYYDALGREVFLSMTSRF